MEQHPAELQKQIDEALQYYSKTVVTHWLDAAYRHAMPDPDGFARITGPCGDTMEIYLKISDERIKAGSFLTDGCITSIASGSMAVHLAQGSHIFDALRISQATILDALQGLPEESVHCALLASNTLKAAIRYFFEQRDQTWKRLYRSAL